MTEYDYLTQYDYCARDLELLKNVPKDFKPVWDVMLLYPNADIPFSFMDIHGFKKHYKKLSYGLAHKGIIIDVGAGASCYYWSQSVRGAYGIWDFVKNRWYIEPKLYNNTPTVLEVEQFGFPYTDDNREEYKKKCVKFRRTYAPRVSTTLTEDQALLELREKFNGITIAVRTRIAEVELNGIYAEGECSRAVYEWVNSNDPIKITRIVEEVKRCR